MMNELIEMGILIEMGKVLMEEIRKDMGISIDDWEYYLEQVTMDNKGFGINAIIRQE